MSTKYTVPEVVALVTALIILVLVILQLPSKPGWPAQIEFKNPEFNPFTGNPRYRPPVCEETAFHWNSKDFAECAADKEGFEAKYRTVELNCNSETKVPDAIFMEPLYNEGRLNWVNFTGPVSGQPVSAIVVTPDPNRVNPNEPTPVIYALHARDQSYENMWADGSYITTPVTQLHLGFKGWVQDTMCEANDPKMQPHILVIPMRGGDRMWIDCKDADICALETQVTQELVPYIDEHYNTIVSAESRACIGYSMGASGCLNYAIKYPHLFGSVLVQSPGVWPRFVTWDELVSSDGAKTSAFSTRDFLLDKVFDGKAGYEALNTCNALSAKLHNGLDLQQYRPKIRVWFGQRDPYIAQDEALFGCFACDQMCQKFHIVKECTHSDFFRCLKDTSSYEMYLNELHNLFER
jgi:enterochelin esterase-like enzyme